MSTRSAPSPLHVRFGLPSTIMGNALKVDGVLDAGRLPPRETILIHPRKTTNLTYREADRFLASFVGFLARYILSLCSLFGLVRFRFGSISSGVRFPIRSVAFGLLLGFGSGSAQFGSVQHI